MISLKLSCKVKQRLNKTIWFLVSSVATNNRKVDKSYAMIKPWKYLRAFLNKHFLWFITLVLFYVEAKSKQSVRVIKFKKRWLMIMPNYNDEAGKYVKKNCLYGSHV